MESIVNSNKQAREEGLDFYDEQAPGSKGSPKSAMRLTKINGKRIFVKHSSNGGGKNLLSPSLANLGYTNGIAGGMFPVKPSEHSLEQADDVREVQIVRSTSKQPRSLVVLRPTTPEEQKKKCLNCANMEEFIKGL
jgi:hypothetical protein